jgi:alanyl-tRNA synthetase
MTPEEVARVEQLVNSWVADASPTTTEVGSWALLLVAGRRQ